MVKGDQMNSGIDTIIANIVRMMEKVNAFPLSDLSIKSVRKELAENRLDLKSFFYGFATRLKTIHEQNTNYIKVASYIEYRSRGNRLVDYSDDIEQLNSLVDKFIEEDITAYEPKNTGLDYGWVRM